MFQRGLADTELTGTSILPSRVSRRGAMKPCWTCIAVVLRHGREAPIRITAGRTEQCTCSRRQILTRSLWPYSKALKLWDCNDSRIPMVKSWNRREDAHSSMKQCAAEKDSQSSVHTSTPSWTNQTLRY